MSHYRNAVKAFHQAFAVPSISELNRHERMAAAALRATLIREEALELRRADIAWRRDQTPENFQHLAKELADLLYVTAGTSQVLHTALLDTARTWPLAPAFFAEGNVQQATVQTVNSLDYLVYLLDGDVDEETLQDELDELGSYLQELVDRIEDFAATYRIPLRAVFDQVHASNMSKVNPATGKAEYREDGKVLKGPGYAEADLSFVTPNAA